MGFVLPRGCIDMGEMDAAQVGERTEAARSWIHAFAQSHNATVAEGSPGDLTSSFDVFALDDLSLWLLHNPFVSVVGAVTKQPAPGRAWAVDDDFVDFSVPDHLSGWGPNIIAAHELNAELTVDRWGDVSPRARSYANRFKPATVAQALFNYWD